MTTTSEEITQLCEGFAGDLSGLLHDPISWAPWIRYMLEQLEGKAIENGFDQALPERYELTLQRPRDAIIDRLNNQHW